MCLRHATKYSYDIGSRRIGHLDTTTDLIPVTVIGMSPFPVARSVFIGSHAVVCTGLARSVVQHSRLRLYFVKDAGVRRPKLDSAIRKSLSASYLFCR